MKLSLLALLPFFFFAKIAAAQDAAAWKKTGNGLLAAHQYQPALEAFQQADKSQPADAETRTNIGICHYHLHQPAEAAAQLFAAFQAKNEPPPLAFLYLAKLHQARLDFEKAADFYKQFLKKTPQGHPWRAAVKDEIRRCATGLRVRRQTAFAPTTVGVLPLADLNTAADEFKPLPSPSGQERLYFSTNGRSASGTDIFFSEVKNGDWAAPKPFNVFVNSAEQETALGFDENGNQLYFFRGKTPNSGAILVDSFRENPLEQTLFFETFTGPIRPGEGDCEPYFFNDTILIFASRRAGGLGGLDLYVCTRTDGTWASAENLGPVINSAYDDTSPFLARDGRSLYFSTNDAARSMGGLDILTATWLDGPHRWSPPENLGPPVNSADDDEHFMLLRTGDRAFFSSDRITGEGGRDLFLALFDSPREEQLGESWPVAFCLVATPLPASPASERAVQPSGSLSTLDFFDEITSFELPVMELPAPGGTPSERTVSQFALLAQLMKKYPKLKVTLALHSAVGDDPLFSFSFASQTTTDLLRQEGVSKQNLTLLFAGSSFPPTKVGASVGAATNRRAEIFIENPAELPFELYRLPLPPSAFKAIFFQKSMTSLAYRVTVDGEAGLKKLFELYPEGMMEAAPLQGRLVFTPGIYLTHASAEEWRRSLEKDGYKEAKITAHLRGRALSKEDAAKYIGDFPDLRNFMGE